jgi:hypothetical protein
MKDRERDRGGERRMFPDIDWTYISIGSDKAANIREKKIIS